MEVMVRRWVCMKKVELKPERVIEGTEVHQKSKVKPRRVMEVMEVMGRVMGASEESKVKPERGDEGDGGDGLF